MTTTTDNSLSTLGNLDPGSTSGPPRGLKAFGERFSPGAVSGFAMRNALLVALIIMIIYFAMSAGPFLGTTNVRNLMVQSAINLVVAVPVGLMLMSNQVDLSVGSVVGITAVVTGLSITSWGLPVGVAIIFGILTGAVIGCVNGFLVSRVGMSSMIVTLGGFAGFRGLAQVIAPQPVYGFGNSFDNFGSGRIGGVPYLALVAIAVIVLGTYVLAGSPWGKHIRATGVSEQAAFLSGIRTKQITWALFVATGAAAGLGGVMTAARLDSAPASQAGLNLELQVLTACLLGGITMGGGRGAIRGIVLGVLFLVILTNGMVMLNVQPAWTQAAQGFVLILGALLDLFANKQSVLRGLSKSG